LVFPREGGILGARLRRGFDARQPPDATEGKLTRVSPWASFLAWRRQPGCAVAEAALVTGPRVSSVPLSPVNPTFRDRGSIIEGLDLQPNASANSPPAMMIGADDGHRQFLPEFRTWEQA
jgi:hypothetical protein